MHVGIKCARVIDMGMHRRPHAHMSVADVIVVPLHLNPLEDAVEHDATDSQLVPVVLEGNFEVLGELSGLHLSPGSGIRRTPGTDSHNFQAVVCTH